MYLDGDQKENTQKLFDFFIHEYLFLSFFDSEAFLFPFGGFVRIKQSIYMCFRLSYFPRNLLHIHLVSFISIFLLLLHRHSLLFSQFISLRNRLLQIDQNQVIGKNIPKENNNRSKMME